MQASIDILSFASIILLLLMSGVLLKNAEKKQHFLTCAFFCLSVAGYLLVSWEPLPKILYYLFHIPTFSASFAFWLFSKSIFDDNFSLKKWMLGLLLSVLLLLYINFFYREQLVADSTAYRISLLLHHLPTLQFTFMAIMEASKDKEADLLIDRLQFRTVFVVLTGTIFTVIALIEIAFICEPPIVVTLIEKIAIVIMVFYFALRQLELKDGFFNDYKGRPPVAPPPKPIIDKVLIDQLLGLVEGEKYYRTEGLTISQLAEKMGVKEYKLRQAINQQLGFRNFNDFLNVYRIQEACDHLLDPKKKEHTVLEIAFEVGYNSLAPFNKAFKQITETTPTAYRQTKA